MPVVQFPFPGPEIVLPNCYVILLHTDGGPVVPDPNDLTGQTPLSLLGNIQLEPSPTISPEFNNGTVLTQQVRIRIRTLPDGYYPTTSDIVVVTECQNAPNTLGRWNIIETANAGMGALPSIKLFVDREQH